MPRANLDPLEGGAAKRVLRLLREAQARATAVLADGYKPRGEAPSEYDATFARSRKAALDQEIARLQRALEGELNSAVIAASREAYTFMGRTSGFPVVVDTRVVEFASETAAEEVRAVSAQIRSAIRRTITRATAGGISHGEMLVEIRKALGGEATRARVDRIARTEVNRAYQQQRAAMDEQLAQGGSDLIKRWVTQRDTRVRDTHLNIDGQERELADLFNVGEGATEATPPKSKAGDKANGPLDPSLPAGEAINCRCDVLYIERSQARQKYIRKGAPALRARARIAASVDPSRLVPPTRDRLLAAGRKHEARFRALAEEQERRALAGTGVKPRPPSQPPLKTGR